MFKSNPGHNFRISGRDLPIVVTCFLVLVLPATGMTKNLPDTQGSQQQSLATSHQQLGRTLLDSQRENNYHTPLLINSRFDENRGTGQIHAILPQSFQLFSSTFNSTDNWCHAATLHVNVKACTTSETITGNSLVSLYVGDADYQEPETAWQVEYRYQELARSSRYLHIRMIAGSGPLDSTNYRMNLEAMPLDKGGTFVRFSWSAHYGILAGLVMKAYIATTGRHKVGFTRQGADEQGETIFIKGPEGVIERNAMRYFLALESWLKTTSLAETQRRDASLNHWFKFTERYRPQLFELSREEYIENKSRELNNQLSLQNAIDNPQDYSEQDDQAVY